MHDESETFAALRRRISRLEDQLDKARGELTSSELARLCAEDILLQVHGVDLKDPPPTELSHALRSGSDGPFQGVWVPLGKRRRVHVLVEGAAIVDPAAEAAVWTWLRRHAQDEPAHPFTRAEMPAHLVGVAGGNGHVIISAALSGQAVIQARRALLARPTRRPVGLVLGIASIPVLLAWRVVRGALIPGQAAAPAAAAAAAMPLVTAAAMTSPAVVSTLTPPRPPAEVQVDQVARPVDHISALPQRKPAAEPSPPEEPPAAEEDADTDLQSPSTVVGAVAPVRLTSPPAPKPVPDPEPDPAPEECTFTPAPGEDQGEAPAETDGNGPDDDAPNELPPEPSPGTTEPPAPLPDVSPAPSPSASPSTPAVSPRERPHRRIRHGHHIRRGHPWHGHHRHRQHPRRHR